MGGPQLSLAGLGAWSFLLVVLAAGPASAHGPIHDRLEHASKQIEADPQNGELLVRRAALYLEHGEFNLAIDDTVRAKELGSDGPGAPLLHARALRGLGRFDEALRVSSGAITNAPSLASGYIVRAEVLQTMGRLRDASTELAVAIRCIDKPSVDLYLKRSLLLVQCDDIEAALECLAQGLVEISAVRTQDRPVEEGQHQVGVATDRLAVVGDRPCPVSHGRAAAGPVEPGRRQARVLG